MPNGELILYATDDGVTKIQFRTVDGTVWLTQAEIAELFDTTKQNISLHIKNILSSEELVENSVVKEYLTTAADSDPEPCQKPIPTVPASNCTVQLGRIQR